MADLSVRGLSEAKEIALGRVGHYCTSDGDAHRCETALVVHVWSQETVNLAVFNVNGPSRGETSVYVGSPESHREARSFHLNRDCPFGR